MPEVEKHQRIVDELTKSHRNLIERQEAGRANELSLVLRRLGWLMRSQTASWPS